MVRECNLLPHLQSAWPCAVTPSPPPIRPLRMHIDLHAGALVPARRAPGALSSLVQRHVPAEVLSDQAGRDNEAAFASGAADLKPGASRGEVCEEIEGHAEQMASAGPVGKGLRAGLDTGFCHYGRGGGFWAPFGPSRYLRQSACPSTPPQP